MQHLHGKHLVALLLAVGMLAPLSVLADPPEGHGHGNGHGNGGWKHEQQEENEGFQEHHQWNRHDQDRDEDRDNEEHHRLSQRHYRDYRFNTTQRSRLEDLLLGRSSSTLLSARQRYAIAHQDDLPPGIRANLARGKRLPPGIAKKLVPLSGRVNSYLGFPNQRNVRIGVLDRDVVMYDPSQGTILDVLRNFLSY